MNESYVILHERANVSVYRVYSVGIDILMWICEVWFTKYYKLTFQSFKTIFTGYPITLGLSFNFDLSPKIEQLV
jgi:hypothetical protein